MNGTINRALARHEGSGTERITARATATEDGVEVEYVVDGSVVVESAADVQALLGGGR